MWPLKMKHLLRALFIIHPLGISIIGYIMLNSGFRNHEIDLILYGITFTILGLSFSLFFIKRFIESLTFKEIPMHPIDVSKIKSVLLNHKVFNYKEYKRGFICVVTNVSLFSWGSEEITIILDDDRILINGSPTDIRQPIVFFRNQANIKKIIKELDSLV